MGVMDSDHSSQKSKITRTLAKLWMMEFGRSSDSATSNSMLI